MDALTKPGGGDDGVAEAPLAAGEFDKRLVEGQWLDERAQLPEDRHQTTRHLAVVVVITGQDHRHRAAAHGFGHRHRRADPGGPGLVGGRSDHAATAIAADQHRPARQLGPPQHLDRSKEAVHVGVQHPARRGAPTLPGWAPVRLSAHLDRYA